MVYLFTGNFWLMTGRAVAVGTGMALTLAFANLFDPYEFGKYKYVIAIAGFVGAFGLGGLGGALTRAIAQNKKTVTREVARTAFLWSLPASACALVGSLYYFFNGNTELGGGLLLIAVTNSPMNTFVLAKSIMLGARDFRAMTLYGLPRSVVPVIALIFTLLLTQNVLIVLAVYFISNLLMAWLLYSLTLRIYAIPDGNSPDAKETILYGKHLSVMGVMSQVVGNLDQLLLWHFAGPVQLAIYTFALAPIREVRNFSENIYPLIFPKYATKTVEEMKQTAPLRIMQLLSVSVVIAGLYIALAPFLYKFIFPQYVSAIFASQLLAASLIFQPRGIVDTMLYAEANTRLRYAVIFTTQGTKVLLLLFLVPLYGLMGAITATVLTDAASALVSWWAYRKMA